MRLLKMAQVQSFDEANGGAAGQRPSRATFFGAPIGELGWFASLLIGAALGFSAFFMATFVGIVSISIFNSVAHSNVDLARSYLWGGIPVGAVVLLGSWAYLGKLWVARVTGK
jgi:hypothetical protein